MLRIWVLGQFVIEADGVALEPPRGRHARSLLAWLALHPGLRLRSRLAARFWPDVLDSSARASLRVALSEVRSALGSAAAHLHADRTHAGLASDGLWVDALAFETLAREGELEEAVELCRGELLPDLDDDWVLDARDAYASELVELLARLASEREAAGDLAAAISFNRRMVAVDPLSEAATRDLMRRLAAAGERGAALAAYRRLAERMHAQLRLAPGPATRALAREIRSTDVAAGSEDDDAESLSTGFELAVSHYRQTLERSRRTDTSEARQAELLLDLGTAESRAGETSRATAAFREAARLARRLGATEVLGRAALGLAGIGVTILDVDETLTSELTEALAALPEDDSPLRAELLARLAIARVYSPDRTESRHLAEQAVQTACRTNDPATVARALCARHAALAAPDELEQRLATATEMLDQAERADDRASGLQARNFLVVDLLEAGDLPGFDRELDAYAALCHQFPLPAFRWYVPLWRATRATIDGDYDESARFAARAREQGRQAGDDNAEHFWRIQTGTLLMLQGEFDADTAWIEDHARTSPAGSAWRTVLAWIWAEQGRTTDARTVLDRLAERDFAALERDMNWLPAIAELIHACRRLGDAERAALLYRQLTPFSGRVVTAARGAQAYGPVDHFLALAAQTAGEPESAATHRAAALRLSESAGARAWADATRASAE